MSHSNIALFVPHIGCPCRCSFCDQLSITQSRCLPTETDVHNAMETALKSAGYQPEFGEIAFFGGSFTAIDRDYMISLLSAAKRHIDGGDARGIRISTRPDCIDDDVLTLLKHYGVTAIELGAQSMDDEVLRKNRRGHDSECVVNASEKIKKSGFELGLQMMTGLYGDTDEGAVRTAEKIIALSPQTVRIYPTVVFENTELDRLMKSGEYIPQTAEQAVLLGTRLIPMFESAGIKVIRFGLHTAQQSQITGGAWHPALAQLVYSQIIKENILRQLNSLPTGEYDIYCRDRDISTVVGQKRSNIDFFKERGYDCRVIGVAEMKKCCFKITERKKQGEIKIG